jgi:hypothetical protein
VWSAAAASLRAVADPLEAAARLERTVRGIRGMVADLFAPPVLDPLAEHCSGLSRRFDVMQIPLAPSASHLSPRNQAQAEIISRAPK